MQGMLLHKATASRPGEVVVLPNSHKQTQKVKQNEETEKCVPNERTRLNPKGGGKQKNNKKEISNLLHKEFKVMVIKMLIKFEEEWKNTELQQRVRKYKKEPIKAEECNN